MSDDTKLSLPGSGYEQVSKILHAYALCGDKPVSLDDVAAKAAMNPSVVSRNNGFLVSIGLLSGGRAKSLTPGGKELALALGHDLQEDAAISWKRAILGAPAAKPVIDMLKVQRAVTLDALPAKIAAALGQPDSPATKTGTNTLIEIFHKANLIKESDGKITLVDENEIIQRKADEISSGSSPVDLKPTFRVPAVGTPSVQKAPADRAPTEDAFAGGTSIPIHVNIQLHLPASAEQSVYDALFKSIREHLLAR
jgi:hypothetical protein